MARSTLEQWRMLEAVVTHGGFAQAAEAIHKSQSSINHAVHKLEDQLGVDLLTVKGRKAVLTEAGQLLLRRAALLLEQADSLEELAGGLGQGLEAEVNLAVDAIFPRDRLYDSLQHFSDQYPNTRVQVWETVLEGGNELLFKGQTDLAITAFVPQGFLGDALFTVKFIAVAHPDHELHRLAGPLHLSDLQAYRQIVVRDSSEKRADSGWLGAEQRWTVTHMSTSIDMISKGLGFAWLPETHIQPQLEQGLLRPLSLAEGGSRYITLYLVYANKDLAGPSTQALAERLCLACGNEISKK